MDDIERTLTEVCGRCGWIITVGTSFVDRVTLGVCNDCAEREALHHQRDLAWDELQDMEEWKAQHEELGKQLEWEAQQRELEEQEAYQHEQEWLKNQETHIGENYEQ